MAAGVGSRLMPYTQEIPKALLPVLSVPCAQFTVDFCAQLGVKHFVFNGHHLFSKLQKGLERLNFHGGTHVLSDESKKLLGSLGGVRTALPHLGDGAFLRVNADRIIDLSLNGFFEAHQQFREKHGVEATLLLMKSQDPETAYPEVELDSKTSLIKALKSQKVRGTYFAGVAVMESSGLKHFQSGKDIDFVKEYFVPLIEKKKIAGFMLSDRPRLCLDLDTPKLWIQAHEALTQWIEGASASAWLKQRVMSVNDWVEKGQLMHRQAMKQKEQILAGGKKIYLGFTDYLEKSTEPYSQANASKSSVFYNDRAIF